MDKYRNRRVLIVGMGKVGFSLINFFNSLNCEIRVTDQRPIFDLSKIVKRLKKMRPGPEMTFGEYRDEDFLDADVVVYDKDVRHDLPQLELARMHGKEVYSEFGFSVSLCKRPLLAVCGAYGTTTVAHMIGHVLKLDGKKVFIGGSGDNPMINFYISHPEQNVDYVIIEVGVLEILKLEKFTPELLVFHNMQEKGPVKRFKSLAEYQATQLSVLDMIPNSGHLIVNYDKLKDIPEISQVKCKTFWYSRKSFLSMGIGNKVFGTHFHQKRIHSNIHFHSEFRVNKMRIVGERNRENLLAAITACKTLKASDDSIQKLIELFPGIPHRLEYIIERNGVKIYNDSKSENMEEMAQSLLAFKSSIILIAGGKDTEQSYDGFFDLIKEKVRVLVLVGESKERMNRSLGDSCLTYLVGSFEESVLIAYQKSRTGDIILMSPGNSATDIFRDYEERGNYFKKLVYQL